MKDKDISIIADPIPVKTAQAEGLSLNQPPDLLNESISSISEHDDLLLKFIKRVDASVLANVGNKADATTAIINKEVIPLLRQIEKNTSFNPAGYPLKHIDKAKRAAKIAQKAQDSQKKPIKAKRAAQAGIHKEQHSLSHTIGVGQALIHEAIKETEKAIEGRTTLPLKQASKKAPGAKIKGVAAMKNEKAATPLMDQQKGIVEPLSSNIATPDKEPSKSREALDQQRAKKSEARVSKSIGKSVKESIGGLIGKGYERVKGTLDNSDVKDKIGSIGGPIWEAAKELKETADEVFASDFSGKVKGYLTKGKSKKTVKKESDGRLRDEKGHFISQKKRSKPNEKQIEDLIETQIETSEDTTEAIKKTGKEASNNHRELLRAVRRIDTDGGLLGGGGGLGMGLNPFGGGRRKGKPPKAGKKGMLSRLFRSKGGKIAATLGGMGGLAMLGGGGGPLELLAGALLPQTIVPNSDPIENAMEVADTAQSASPLAKKSAKKITEKTTVKTAEKIGTKGLAKVGTKGALKLAGRGLATGLRALGPIAALGMAGFDAFQGWKDKDMQKEAFNLKEGQEANTFQKIASSAANVVDMGGLGTGLLNAFGVDVKTADIAKGFNWLGEAVGFSDPEKGEKTTAQKVVGAMLNPATLLGLTRGWLGLDGDKSKSTKVEQVVAREASDITQQSHINLKKPEMPQPLSSIDHGRNTRKPMSENSVGPLADNRNLSNNISALVGRIDRLIISNKTQGKASNKNHGGGEIINTEFDDTVLTLLAYDKI